jgi:two-component sensor histidine kinase
MRKRPIPFLILFCFATIATASTIDSLRQKLATAKDDTAKVWLLQDLGMAYSLRNMDSSILLLRQSADLSEKLGFHRGAVSGLLRLATNVGLKGDPKAEESLLHQALQISLRHGYKQWLGRTYIKLADVNNRNLKPDSTLYYCNLAEKANIETGMEYENWHVFNVRATIYNDQGDMEKAEQNYRAALQLTSQKMIRKDHGLLLFNMLYWYFSQKDWAKYSEISEQYIKFMAEGNKGIGQDAIHGILYFFDKNASTASKVATLKAIQKQHESLGNRISLANTYKLLGETLREGGDLDGALDAYKQAAVSNREIGMIDTEAHCTQMIYEIYEAKKDIPNAFVWYKKFQAIDDSLNTLAVQKNISELEVKYETGKMEAEITQQQLKLEAAGLARRNLAITVGALALAVLGTLGFLYFKSKTNKELAAKNGIISTALGEKELLLREIHHRVKNNLQVISSLLHLQSKYIEDEKAMEVMREGRNRVKSMALIHQDLYQNDNLTSVEVAPYLRKLTEGLFQSYNIDPDRIRLRSEVDAPRLDVDTLIPLGLILNELVSNALKHAFPNERPGEVAVSLKSLENALQLEVRDNGVGFAEHQKTKFEKSFGFEMVKTFAAKLKAKLEVENAEGTLVRLVIPQVA